MDSADRYRQTFGSSFRTFDATDYQVIATIDTKRLLFDLCADHADAYMAVIETQVGADDILSLEENLCRLYEVGKTKVEDEDEEAVRWEAKIFCPTCSKPTFALSSI